MSDQIGRWLIIGGLGLVIVGALFLLIARAGISPGRLPGDVSFENGPVRVYIPFVTCLLLSGLASLLVWAFSWLRR